MNACDTFQAEVGRWAKETFPNSDDRAKLKHLEKEVLELLENPCAEEAADCFLILLHFSEAHGFSLFDAARDKFEVAKRRKWGKPDADGVVEHVRDLEPARAKPFYGTCLECGAARPCGFHDR